MVLLQNSDNLFLGKSGLLHRLSPQAENRLTFKRGQFWGAGQAQSFNIVHATKENTDYPSVAMS